MKTIYLMTIFVTIVLSFPVFSSGPSCAFTPPSDPSNCALSAASRIRYEALKSAVKQKYSSEQKIDTDYLDEIITIANYLSSCEKKRCRDYDFKITTQKEFGWSSEKSVLIGTTDNVCAYNKAYLTADSHTLLNSKFAKGLVQIKKMPKKKTADEPYYTFPSSDIVCSASGHDIQSARSLIVSFKGIYISDTPQVDSRIRTTSVSKRINVRGGGRPKLNYISDNEIQLVWKSGADIRVDGRGKIIDSNFLDPRTYQSESCESKITSGGKRATPVVHLLPGQRFAR